MASAAGSDKDAYRENRASWAPFLHPITRWQVFYITSFCADNFAGAVFQLLYGWLSPDQNWFLFKKKRKKRKALYSFPLMYFLPAGQIKGTFGFLYVETWISCDVIKPERRRFRDNAGFVVIICEHAVSAGNGFRHLRFFVCALNPPPPPSCT